jgi:serine/threonine-protein kinase
VASPALELKVDEILPGTKYRIVKSVGAGGMGIVYQVVKPPNIQGVLKLMSSDLTKHEEHRMRFFDEVRILAQLEHPNIVRVFDYDALSDGTPYYVMELLTGRTVRDVLQTVGRVPPRVAYEITRQLLEALQAAHTHEVPVIHRDVKPENIFLHAPKHGEPVVKLIDFGVSAVADRTHDGAFVGTWSYAAPEQIRGERPTPATDLYAAALVLYEMLVGFGPFDHYQEWTEVSEAQLNEVPPPVSKHAPWVPASIVSLIQSALAKDPRSRPRDAYAFAERLFELEWASDGKDPHDATVAGPGSGAMKQARAIAEEKPTRDVDAPPGPLSKILSSVTNARASSKNMAAASPAPDRLGDVPLIGVPPEAVKLGSTWQGVGGKEFTSPDAESLLAGLDLPSGGKPASKKERESNPELPTPFAPDVQTPRRVRPESPRTPRVIVRDSDSVIGDATTMEAGEMSSARELRGAREAESGRELPATRDTFSSQNSDPGLPPARGWTGPLLLAAAVIAAGLAIASIIVAKSDPKRSAVTATQAPTATAVTAPAASEAVAPAVAATDTAPAAAPTAAAAAPTAPAPAPTAAGSANVAPKAAPGKVKGGGKKTAAPEGSTPGSASPRAPAPAQTTTGSGDFIRGL